MKITDCELVTVPKMDKFDKIYEIKDKDVLLDTIHVYGLDVYGKMQHEINFEIKSVFLKNTVYPLDMYDSYMIQFYKLVKAKKIEINKEDYFYKKSSNDNYTFYINE